jgi:hypothetical protein
MLSPARWIGYQLGDQYAQLSNVNARVHQDKAGLFTRVVPIEDALDVPRTNESMPDTEMPYLA